MSVERLTDLDALLVRCPAGASRDYASEAIASYRGGAYRASIVTIWIAVVFDIMQKIRDLAAFGSPEAKQKTAAFDSWHAAFSSGNIAVVSQALSFEREIIAYAKDKLELFDQQQFVDLRRLQEDRNRCAHPTFQHEGIPYQPSGELARMHICHAITHVLQQPPVQGRSARTQLSQIVASNYFPEDFDKAREALAQGVLARPSDALVKGVIDDLLIGYFAKDSALRGARKTLAALNAVLTLHANAASERFRTQAHRLFGSIEDEDLGGSVRLAELIPEYHRALADAQLEKLAIFLRSAPFEKVGRFLSAALKVPALAQSAQIRISKLDSTELGAIVSYGVRAEAVERAVDLFCAASTWNTANFIAGATILPLMENVKPNHVVRVVEAASDRSVSDLRFSGGFNKFLGLVVEKGVMKQDELAGLLKKNGLDEEAEDVSGHQGPE